MKKYVSVFVIICLCFSLCLLTSGCGTISTEKASAYVDGDISASEGEAGTCTISIDCKTILDNMEKLDKTKTALVPEDGVIYPETVVKYDKGDSVLDILKKVTMDNKIHMEYSDSPTYGGGYVEGIANIYEFDCGSASGWEFSVNGWFPNYSGENYEVGDGDVICWRYSCENGKDIHGNQ